MKYTKLEGVVHVYLRLDFLLFLLKTLNAALGYELISDITAQLKVDDKTLAIIEEVANQVKAELIVHAQVRTMYKLTSVWSLHSAYST